LDVELSPEGRVWSSTSGTLAGSALLMPVAVANLSRFAGLPIEECLRLASTRPAEYLGETPRGTLDLDWDPATGTLRVAGVRS
jgi:N-acetylglucosamine-6-phosphate deacetylase